MACNTSATPSASSMLSRRACRNVAGRSPAGRRAGGSRATVLRCRSSTSSPGISGRLRLELDENPGGIISGEWPDNFSFLSFDDLRVYIESQNTSTAAPNAGDHQKVVLLSQVMSAPARTASTEQSLGEVDHHFETVSGLPVVDGDLRCVGVVSKKDRARATQGPNTRVGDIMSTPVITLPAGSTIIDAAATMLNMKIHRIPIVDDEMRCIGIVTRNDVLQGLEALLQT